VNARLQDKLTSGLQYLRNSYKNLEVTHQDFKLLLGEIKDYIGKTEVIIETKKAKL